MTGKRVMAGKKQKCIVQKTVLAAAAVAGTVAIGLSGAASAAQVAEECKQGRAALMSDIEAVQPLAEAYIRENGAAASAATAAASATTTAAAAAAVAGASVALESYLAEQTAAASVPAVIEGRQRTVVTMAADEIADSITGKYNNPGIANVATYLNIRTAPVDGEIIGLLPADGVCELLEETDNGWYKISSGGIEGYVSGDYLLTGGYAAARASESAKVVATVTVTGGLNLRKKATTASGRLLVLRAGAKAEVLEDLGDWLKVSYNGVTGYVFSKYVSEECGLSEAVSIEKFNRSTASAVREEIVAYAKQFVGNPYVYGGNSLTKGTDCSGFVKLIMAHFDITMPRTASTQYASGKKISVDELLPGDLIVYGNKNIEHIGLYIGDGMIIHASTAKTGIKYSKYNYRTIYGCVRYVED